MDYGWNNLSDQELYKFFYFWNMAVGRKDEKSMEYYASRFFELFGRDGHGLDEKTRAYTQLIKARDDYSKQTHR